MNKAEQLYDVAHQRGLAKLAANHPTMDDQAKLYFHLLDLALTAASQGHYQMNLGAVETVPIEVAIKLRHDGFGIKLVQHGNTISYEMMWTAQT